MTEPTKTEVLNNLTPTVIASGHEGTLRDQFNAWVSRVKNGEMGSLPAVGALLVLGIIFSVASPYFLTELNFANLFVQAAELTVLAMALVFVILLAEIDLSAGVAAGVAMDIFYLVTAQGINWIPAFLLALAVGAVVGLVLGFFVSRIGVPSFVVTLAFYLAFQGIALILLGDGGLFRVDIPEVSAIMNQNLPLWGGWAMVAVMVLGSWGLGMYDRARRAKHGLVNKPIQIQIFKTASLGILSAITVVFLNLNRSQSSAFPIEGVPIVIPIVIGLLFVGTFVLDRTRFGRHLYAVGGNPEAARRAGIKVSGIRIAAFVICSTLAVVSGLLHVSRIGIVEAAAGRTIVLSGVAAAVVGGVSLFGGRGRLIHAAIGALVISIIDNGLGLLGLPAGISFLVTGSVLALAATIDALSRKRSGGSVARS